VNGSSEGSPNMETRYIFFLLADGREAVPGEHEMFCVFFFPEF
jgi:hypothetical protein